MFWKVMKNLVLGGMAVATIAIGLNLFFGVDYMKAFSDLKNYFNEVSPWNNQVENLVIVEPDQMVSYEPTVFDLFTRQRLNNIYEPLVTTDSDLNIKGGLAVSWGLIDDKTWEFTLRSGVKFHDGVSLQVEDVVSSIERAKSLEGSQLKDLLSTVKEVKKIDEKTFKITTGSPDPLLLQRLSTVYIVPANFDVGNPVGTGPYKAGKSSCNAEQSCVTELDKFDSFDDYWGGRPKFKKVEFVAVADPVQRFSILTSGKADILDYVPYDLVEKVSQEKFDVLSVPNLEVQFLLFNFESKLFSNLEVRKASKGAIDQYDFASKIGSFAHGVNQFVSSGVFGYNTEISESILGSDNETLSQRKELISNAAKIIEDTKLKDSKVSILLPYGLDVLGNYLVESLKNIGLETVVQYVKPEYYQNTVQDVKPDIYFMAFKSDLGDSSDFLESVALSSGQYNFSHYSNKNVDDLIKKQEVTMDEEKRLSYLKDAMKIVVDDDVIGVPLIEYDRIFAMKKEFAWSQRIDGFIYLKDL